MNVGKLNTLPFEAWISVVALTSGISALVDPAGEADEAIAALGNPWYSLFAVQLILAGLGMMVGLATKRINIEAAGLVFLIGAVAVDLTAVFLIQPRDIATSTLVLSSAAVAAAVRLYEVLRGRYTVQVQGGSPFRDGK